MSGYDRGLTRLIGFLHTLDKSHVHQGIKRGSALVELTPRSNPD